jgi:hypothetical protein
MFCALNGATATPRRRSHAQTAVAIQLLPAFDEVPPMNSGFAATSGPSELTGFQSQQASERDLPAATTVRPIPFLGGHS